ncbi:response regulator [Pseudoalteromonas phenolica]|uniref:PAS domain-containing hybrid sensor histidine kinase/response regulator n=1 Tax=Pseudoalteromonas phenolica TaxID=161398 RepID=UPI00384C30D4
MNRLEEELYNKISTDKYVFDFIQESSLDGLWYWDLEEPEDEWMSPKFWTTLGYDPTSKQHKSSEWQDIINQEDLKAALDNFNRHIEDPSFPYDQIVRYQHSLGHTVWIRCRGLILRDDNNKPIRMIGAHTDVTQLKLNEQKAINALQARDKFFARMSHEIRTPLFGMLGVTESLLAEPSNLNIKSDLTTILSCGEQLQRILNDILTLAKIDAGKLALSIETVSLSNVLEHISFLFSKPAEAKKLNFVVNFQSCENLFVDTDKVRLIQILGNLVSNSIKYTDVGSITVSSSKSNTHCSIQITDTGIGIEDIDKIMLPFEQETNVQPLDANSSGLGLDVVSHLCELLKIEFSIDSALGKGTQVKLTLPLKKIETPETTNAPTQAPDYTQKLGRILIVDDNTINLIIAEKMLSPLCACLDKAKDGIKSLELINKNQYDIVLLDINMPHMDGFEVLKELKSLNLTYKPKIYMLTADAYETTKKRCLSLGCDGFLTKPFSKQQLLSLLHS